MKKYFLIISILVFVVALGVIIFSYRNTELEKSQESINYLLGRKESLSGKEVSNTSRSGTIEQNEIWSGEILVEDSIQVPERLTLTIKPGTIVKFKHNRDYKSPNKLSLEVHGKLKAVGTKDALITFTSDAATPQNGDWSMIRLFGKTGSEIRYTIIEFGQQGVNMWKSDAVISHSIIRWNNWEGLYAESYSTPLIEYNRVYQNGYNGMAMEQFNNVTLRYNIFEKSGTHGVHIDASKATIEHNILRDNGAAGLSLDDNSEVTARENTISENKLTQIMCGEGENKITAIENAIITSGAVTNCAEEVFSKNTEGSGTPIIDFDFPDEKKYDLSYTPGDREKDKYLYVYPDDETRKIVKKIGKGLGLTWSITIEGKDVWTATVSGYIYKLSGKNGKILRQFKAPSVQPWGMAFDGDYLWITDFAEKRTYAFDPDIGKEVRSFKNPDEEHGAKGLAWDGSYLYIMGWTTNLIYKVDKEGKVLETIEIEGGGGGGLTWDGENFWVPCDGICKISPQGKLLGKIYPASEGTWDLAWESADNAYGGYLWACQRTNENWYDDEKIFKLEILNDSLEK